MVTRYGQADVPREVSDRGGPAVRPAAADFPRDVCLTVYRNHAVFLLGHGLHTAREVSGRGGPAVRPAAADFPRDVCLTVSRNHAVFLLYLGRYV